MRKSYKYRLYPSKKQLPVLERTLETCRRFYNDSLEERIQAWKIDNFSLTYMDQQNDIPAKKEEDEFLASVHSQVLQNVCKRLDKTYRAFFLRLKKGGKAGFPRFKQFGRYDSFCYPQSGFCPMPSGRVRLSGIGEVKADMHRPIVGIIKTCTVKRKADKWYVIFSCDEVPTNILPANSDAVGIDVGLQYFAVLSDGTTIPNPRHYRKGQKKLCTKQRCLSRRKKGSVRRAKARTILQKHHVYVANQRRDFHHKTARTIVNRFGSIAVEELNVAGMTHNRHLSKSISDAGWSQFIGILSCKAEEAGRQFVKVNARGTSQTCECGATVRKTISDRIHSCGSCGVSCKRDYMSARVILQRASF
jgi:putative transposase